MPRRSTRRSLLGLVAAAPAVALAGRVRAAPSAEPAAATEIADEGGAFAGGWLDNVRLEPGAPGGLPMLRPGARGGRYTSRVHRLPAGTTHAGLHWLAAGPGQAATFSLRLAATGERWSAWRPASVELSPGADGAETFAALRDVAPASLLQYRIEFPPAPSEAIRRVAVSAIVANRLAAPDRRARPATSGEGSRFFLPDLTGDPGATLVSRPGYAVGPASGAELPVVSREAWGADEAYRFTPDGHERWREMFVLPRKVVVHHTGSRNGYGPGDATADVRAISYYHSIVQGWGDIGYNALIDHYGAIYEGRHGRGGDPGDALPARSYLNADASAGHTKWHNYGSAGVALIGDSEAPGWRMDAPSGPMWDALVAYTAFACREGNIRPVDATGDNAALAAFLRSDEEWSLEEPSIGGHRLWEATFCPGEPVLAMMPALRKAVYQSLEGTSRSGAVITSATPADRQVQVGTPLFATWHVEPPEPGWTLTGCEYRWEGWFKPEDEDDLDYLTGFSNDSQPLARWIPAPPSVTSASIIPWTPGHYSLHVRPTARRGTTLRPAAFAAAHTWLVTA